MIEPPVSPGQLAATSKQLLRRLHPFLANRSELLVLELKEERPRVLRALLLGLGAALCLTMAVLTLTAFVVVLGWNISPVLVLGTVTAAYLAGGLVLGRKLMALFEGWRAFTATRDQFAKDCDSIQQMMK
jgi:uncharacterized membrane protein YqjE